MSFYRIAFAALAAVALSLSAALPAHAQTREMQIQKLAEEARQKGSVRVLLEMRAKVKAAQDRVLHDLAVHGLRSARRYEHLPFVAAEADEAALRVAAAHPDVLAVHEDRLHRPTLAQSGPLVGAPEAWGMGYGGAGQHIAILDSGVDRNHPFLAGKVIYEACFSTTYAPYEASTACPNGQGMQIGSGAAAPCTSSECQHGTHVAGIAAGNGPNASPPQSFSGIAKDAGLIAIQVFSVFYSTSICGSSGTPCISAFTSDVMSALDHLYAIRQNYSLASANMSFGEGQYTTHCDGDPLKPAIDLLRSAGVATVVASGNDGYVSALSSPACISSAVSVGATTKTPEGLASFTNSAWMLNLLAPGFSILSSVPGASYDSFSGTSMAAPHVAGAFAVLKQKKLTATVDELLTALSSTGVPISDPRNGLFKPRIRLPAALDAVIPAAPALALSPLDGLSSSGPPGGPFSPTSKSYTLTNPGVGDVNFTASTPAAWATVSPASGTLAQGASTTVTVTINGNAASLALGAYSSTVDFSNTTNGIGSASRTVALSVELAPANDKFQDGVALPQSSGNTSGTNVGATKEPGEPNHAGNAGGKSVWWKWTAPATQLVSVDTFGSTFDTLLAVYTGSQVSGLTPVAANDDYGGVQSKLSFQAQQGTTYFIAVDGYNSGFGPVTGAVTLNLSVATPIPPGTSALVYFSQPGDYIGGGQSRQISAAQPNVTITAARNYGGGITLFIGTGLESWDLSFAPPPGAGAPLAVGAYENAVRYPFNSGLSPGISLTGNGRGCNTVRGRFDVLDVAYAPDGSVQRFAADFVQHCEGGLPALFGQIRFDSGVPLDLESVLPAPFGFVDVADVSLGVPVTSNAVAISGITSAPIRVQGGEYSLNGGPFTGTAGTIANGQTVALRLMSSSLPGTATFATVRIGAASATFQVTTALGPGTNMLYFHSQPGDYIGAGQQRALYAGTGYTLTPSRNYHNGVSFSISGGGQSWSLDLAGPQTAPLAVGSYENAVRFPFENGTSPGISLSGDGRGCNTIRGRFDVLEVSYGGDGSVQRFAADFVQHCEGGLPALFGQIRFNSNAPIYIAPVLPAPFAFADAVDVPRGVPVASNAVTISGITTAPISVQGGEYSINGGPFTGTAGTIANGQTVALRVMSSSLPGTATFATVRIGAASATFQVTTAFAPGTNMLYFHSQPGDYIGAGRQRALYAGTGYTLTPSRNYHNGVSFNVSGNGEWWSLDFGGPAAAPLAVGSYENAVRFPFENGVTPGISLTGNGRGCNTVRGRFDVLDVAYAANGSVQRFAADFVQHCEGGAPALFGQIRFNSDAPIYIAPVLPAPFAFVNAVDVPRGVSVISNAVAISGITSAPISVQGGEYSISGGPFTSAAGTIANGQSVALRLMSSSLPGTATFATVRIGAASATFQATTAIAQIGTNVLYYKSPPGDYIGQGQTRLLHAGTGFSLTPSRNYDNGVTFNINGSGQYWTLNLAAPGNPPSSAPPLAAGSYEGAVRFPFQPSGQPGLDFYGDGRGCNQLSGRFDVLQVTYGAGGAVSSFAANFEQRCENFMPALLGRIRYNSSVPLFNTTRRDHDGDGKADILWRNSSTGENYVYPMNGTAILGNEGYLRTVQDQNWHVAGIGDFDGDGKADILWRNSDTGANYIYLMNGTAIAGEGYLRTVSDQNWKVVGTGDFDDDGKDDILWRNSVTGENYLYLMDGKTIKPGEGYLRAVADTTWQIVGVGDFNGDGKSDILWRNSVTGQNYLYLMNDRNIAGEGYLRTVTEQAWEVKGVGDFDGDGKADIVWRNASSGENYLYPMDGTAIKPSEGYLRTVPDPAWRIVAVGDYDGDGKSDIFWRNSSSGENYLYPMDGTTIKPTEGYLRTVADQNWKPQSP
jgi:subtilisin family serine protease